jgi:hypothetical protein
VRSRETEALARQFEGKARDAKDPKEGEKSDDEAHDRDT